jgi:hypothetical protein
MKRPLMTRFIKPVFTLVLLLFYTGNGNAQVATDIKGAITQKFLKYCTEVPRQEIFVHSDRDTYIAGEDMWFNIYLFDRKTNKLQTDEKIAYIEVLNTENRPVVQKRILLDKGTGPGQISLPDTLSSGTYTLRAYTNWMKNFMPENCFMEEIKIYNAFRNKAFMNKSYLDQSTVNKITIPVTEGLSLDVNNLNPDNIEIVITTTSTYRSDNKNVFYLFIQTRGNIDHISNERALTEKTVLTIPKSLLTPGINQITIFDAAGNALKERLIFTPEQPVQEMTLTASSAFRPRENIKLEIEFPMDMVKELEGTNMSISVIPEKSGENKISLADYMLFGSEFGIRPLSLLKTGDISVKSNFQIDSLLLTLKSNWIDWGKILSGETGTFKHEHETEYLYLSGRLIKKSSQVPDQGEYVFMSVPGKVAQFQYSKPDDESYFNMKVRIDDRVKDLVIQPGDPDNIASTKIESSFSEKYIPSVPLNNGESVAEASAYINRMSTNYQVNKIYGSTSSGPPASKLSIPEIQPVRFYGKPDIELILDDYIKLPVMEEVFFELIPGVVLKKKKTGYEISIYDPVENKIYEVPPCLMVDGVIIYNPSVIAGLDPEFIERIDIVKDKYLVGDNLFYGLVNVISRAGDFSSVSLPEYATRLQYKVYEAPITFTAPDYSALNTQLSRVPDFRNTLYWNPSVYPDKDGKAKVDFWSSDFVSSYMINIQGVDKNGRKIAIKKLIRVE